MALITLIHILWRWQRGNKYSYALLWCISKSTSALRKMEFLIRFLMPLRSFFLASAKRLLSVPGDILRGSRQGSPTAACLVASPRMMSVKCPCTKQVSLTATPHRRNSFYIHDSSFSHEAYASSLKKLKMAVNSLESASLERALAEMLSPV